MIAIWKQLMQMSQVKTQLNIDDWFDPVTLTTQYTHSI